MRVKTREEKCSKNKRQGARESELWTLANWSEESRKVVTLTRLVGSLFCQICDSPPSFLSFFFVYVCTHFIWDVSDCVLDKPESKQKQAFVLLPQPHVALQERLNLWTSGGTFSIHPSI